MAALVELAAAGLGPTLVPANVLADSPLPHTLRLRPALRRPVAVFAMHAGADAVERLSACVIHHGRVGGTVR